MNKVSSLQEETWLEFEGISWIARSSVFTESCSESELSCSFGLEAGGVNSVPHPCVNDQAEHTGRHHLTHTLSSLWSQPQNRLYSSLVYLHQTITLPPASEETSDLLSGSSERPSYPPQPSSLPSGGPIAGRTGQQQCRWSSAASPRLTPNCHIPPQTDTGWVEVGGGSCNFLLLWAPGLECQAS